MNLKKLYKFLYTCTILIQDFITFYSSARGILINKMSDYGLIRLYSKCPIFINNLVSTICNTLYNILCFIPGFFINLFKNSLFILAKLGYLKCIIFIILASLFIYFFSTLLFVLIGFGVGLLTVIYKTNNYEILFSLFSKLCKILKSYLNFNFIIRLFSILAIIQILGWIKLGLVFSIVLMIYIILLTFYSLHNIIKADVKEKSLVVNLDNILELVVRLSLLSLLVNTLQDDNIIYMKIDDLLNKTSPSHSNKPSFNGGGNGGNNPDKGSLKYILNSDDNQSNDDEEKFRERLYKKVSERIQRRYSNTKLFDKNLGDHTFTEQEEDYILSIKSQGSSTFIRYNEFNSKYLAAEQRDLQDGDCLVKNYNFKCYHKAVNGKITLEKIQDYLEQKINE